MLTAKLDMREQMGANVNISKIAISTIAAALFVGKPAPAQAQTQWTGVSLAGADFGYDVLPGEYGVQYIYPTKQEVDYFIGKGMNIFRLPFLWERLQNEQFGPLNIEELARIQAFVEYATAQGGRVILDPHNYARYYGDVIGLDGDTSAVPVAAFEDFWRKLAGEFMANERVIFALMNEPYEMPTVLWLEDANAAIAVIRALGAENLILVPGNGYSGAHSWNMDYYGTPNAQVMAGVSDPGDNFAYEVHQYLDEDSSGTSQICVSEAVGRERLIEFTQWAREQGAQAFLGEFSVGENPTCLAALEDMLKYMDENTDVWLGWAYWAAGPWWGHDNPSLEPLEGVDRAQMAVLDRHMAR